MSDRQITSTSEQSTSTAGTIVSKATNTNVKPQIVKLGMRLGAPLQLVWSCYRAGTRMCGRCESCARLDRALRVAGASVNFWPRGLLQK